jgi:hypothetical protein
MKVALFVCLSQLFPAQRRRPGVRVQRGPDKLPGARLGSEERGRRLGHGDGRRGGGGISQAVGTGDPHLKGC